MDTDRFIQTHSPAFHKTANEVHKTILTFYPPIVRKINKGLLPLCKQMHLSPITIRQAVVLLALKQNEKTNIKVLATAIAETSASASAMVQRLVQKGLVIRGDDEQDRRRAVITLSWKGTQLANELENLFVSAFLWLLSEQTEQDIIFLGDICRSLPHSKKSRQERCSLTAVDKENLDGLDYDKQNFTNSCG